MVSEWYILVLGTLLIGVVLVFVIRKVVPITPFLYANARIQARTSYLITDQKFRELAEAKSLQELINLLRDTDYAEGVEKIDQGNLKQFHSAVEKGFLKAVENLKDLSPKVSQPLINAYLMFLEAKVLKTIYRSKYLKAPVDKGLLFPVGKITSTRLKHLLEAETIADMRVILEPTHYSKVFKQNHESLEEFEIRLDDFVLKHFVKTVKETKMHEGSFIIEMKNQRVDILNLMALLKFRLRGVDKQKQKKLLINNESPLSYRFSQLINAESLKDFVDACQGLPYHRALSRGLEKYEKDQLMLNFENELWRDYKESVVKNDLHHTLGPYPLFSYLLKKEIEQRNLLVISRLIEARFSPDKIKGMIV